MRRSPLAAAVLIACAGPVGAQGLLTPTAPPSAPASAAAAPRSLAAERGLPLNVQADEIRGRPDLETVAEGAVEAQRGSVVLRADRLSYDHPADLVHARGKVRLEQGGDLFAGSELQLYVQRFEGFLLQPEYFFSRTGGGGTAERIDFIDRQRAQVVDATYTSCPRDGSGGPAWVLQAQRVKMDFETNEGVAEGAVLRFYGVPLLAAPVLSFPLTDERKSGWLPPSLDIDSKSGFDVGIPYYWNIAPNRDATFTPSVLSRRGVALETEFRYLEPADKGELRLNLLPRDREADRSRGAFRFLHEGDRLGVHYAANVLRVSDDAYWKDFSRNVPSITPRLLPVDLQADRRLRLGTDWTAYARVQHWQALQDIDPANRYTSPYQRSPQVGVRGDGVLPFGLGYAVETEVNRFTLPDNEDRSRPVGTRWHLLGSVSRRWQAPGWWFEPRLTLNTASYAIDDALAGDRNRSRTIPTASVDAGLRFEREASWLGRSLRQTLEPRLLYVNTPYRDQSALPLFDTAAKDFNDISVFSENAFAGVDRVSDANQLTVGAISRLLDPATGGEILRVGAAQRVLFRDQRVTPDGTPPLTQRFSDLLLLGSSRLTPTWSGDVALQYRSDTNQLMRSVVAVRYSPGPFRTVSAGYRQTRGLSEQVEVGWQWPLYGAVAGAAARPATPGSGGACKGTLYSVGRTSYSLQDRRITDALVGFEYDAGCWIGRVVAERLSTGRTEATTRLMLQLELVGLSRLGSNPLQALKDNIPGYRLLREERGSTPSAPPVYE